MSVRSKISVLIAGGLLALLPAGCSRDNSATVLAETDEPSYREGQQLLRQDRTHEALTSFLKVIEKRGEQASAESHLEAGIILMKYHHDPLEAIHHFRKYLEQQPNSPKAPLVKGQLLAAGREYASTLAGQPLESQSGRLDTLEQMEKLKRENEQLRAELAATRTSLDSNRPTNALRVPFNDPAPSRAASPITPAIQDISPIMLAPLDTRETTSAPEVSTSASNPAAARGTRPLSKPTAPGKQTAPSATRRTYVVNAGEGLWAVAGKVYGSASAARVAAIAEANRDQLPNGGSSLKPGMVLKIP